jgi:hypothetical protein
VAQTVARCEHCGRQFEVATKFAGGLVSCPHCGRAAEVPGLRDPAWRLLQAASIVFTIIVGVSFGSAFGVAVGAGAMLAAMLLVWLLSRAL